MSLTVYRITRSEFSGTIFSGDGARKYGGRWSSQGVPVIYASQSRALAAMEQLVHLIQPRILSGYVVASITFREQQLNRIDLKNLPTNWSNPVAPAALKQFRDNWSAAGKYPVLAVPSAVIAGEWNFLINPSHPEFEAMAKSAPEPFVYDERLR